VDSREEERERAYEGALQAERVIEMPTEVAVALQLRPNIPRTSALQKAGEGRVCGDVLLGAATRAGGGVLHKERLQLLLLDR